MEFHLVKTGDTFKYNLGTVADPDWVVCTAYVSGFQIAAAFDRITSKGFETVFSREDYEYCLNNGWIVWEAPSFRRPVVLDNTPYTSMRNWRTRPLPVFTPDPVADLVEGIVLDLLDCDDDDSCSDLQCACDDLDGLYGLPGRAGLEGVQ